MRRAADKIPENIEFAAAELRAAPADQRKAMLEQIAKALTTRLLQENSSIGIREVSERVIKFVEAVRARIENPPGQHISQNQFRFPRSLI
jgi:hypothetical protein